MSNMQPPLVTLRAMEPEDLDALYRIENDKQLWCVSATNVPYSRYTLHDYIANSSGDIYTDREVRLIIEDSRQAVVGILDLVNFDPRHLRAEVGIVIERPYRRQGIASAALADLHDYAAQVLHLHQLYAIIGANRTAALSLFRSAGYQHTATLRDWISEGSSYTDGMVMQLTLH